MKKSERRVLVIDDDAITRQIISAYLEKCGFLVREEASGKDGVAWFKANEPDLVLTDLRLPDLDGLSILSIVKEVDALTPVIVISGMGMVDDVVEALRRGAADYIVKPLVEYDVLLHSINRALEVLDLQQENLRYRQRLEAANRELQGSLRVLRRDQLAGRAVQSNMLPETPATLGAAHVAHRVIPSLYLSGDFVDYGLVNDNLLSFYLTDVSGHGAAPAFVTVWLKQLVRRMVRERRNARNVVVGAEGKDVIDAAEWTRLVNKEVLRSKFGCHLTCISGMLDLTTREISFVLAGHLPLPVIVGENDAWFLEGKGKPLGIFPDAKWNIYRAHLPRDHSLVIFSDGVLELLQPKDLIEKERQLLDLLKGTKGDLEAVCSSLGLDNLSDAPDDVAVLTVSLD